MRSGWLIACGVLMSGCATGVAATTPDLAPPPPVAPLAPTAQQKAAQDRDRLVALARTWIGEPRVVKSGRRYPADCTSVIRAAYDELGMDLLSEGHARDNGVTAILRYARAHGRLYTGGHPLPGDLVFFRNTYDRNHDGAYDDGLTHIALVESEDANGTVTLIQRLNEGIVRSRMNLHHRHWHTDPDTGEVLNDYLRIGRGANRDRVTGELFSTYATLLGPGPLPLAEIGHPVRTEGRRGHAQRRR